MGLQGCIVCSVVSFQLTFGNGNHIDAAICQNGLIVEQHLGIAAVGQCQQCSTLTCQELAALGGLGVHAEAVYQGCGDLIPLHRSLYIVSQILVQIHKEVVALHCQGLIFIIVQLQHIVLIVATQCAVQTGDRAGIFTHLHIHIIDNTLAVVVGLYHFLIGGLHLGSHIGSGIVHHRTVTGLLGLLHAATASSQA